MPKLVKRLILLFAGLAVIALSVSWLAVSILTKPRPAPVTQLADDKATGFESIEIQSTDNVRLAGWFAEGDADKGAVLLLHGIGSNRLGLLSRAQWLRRDGYSVLLIDFRGHGESTAAQVTVGYNEADDALAACRFLRQQRGGHSVTVIGMSMGAAAAVLGETAECADKLVLEAMYTRLQDAIGNRLVIRAGLPAAAHKWARQASFAFAWQLPWRFGFRIEELAPIERLKSIQKPVLLIAGALDQRANLAQSRQLFAAANEPKSLWVLPQARHQSFYDHDRKGYQRVVAAFLEEPLKTPTQQ